MKNQTLKLNIDAETKKRLMNAAIDVANNAYAPYSKFRVGAAVIGASGSIFRGANVENASYGLGTCAERVALASARAEGERKIIAIAIACIDSPKKSPLEQRVPCGACRQWLQELAPNAEILILGEERSFSISDLLPIAFKIEAQQDV